jgi:hypothetical protein
VPQIGKLALVKISNIAAPTSIYKEAWEQITPMPTNKLIYLAKEARSLMAFCEQSLWLIGRHMATRAALGEDTAAKEAGIHQEAHISDETARQARALAEDVRDPEVRRLLRELADTYDQSLPPAGKPRHPLQAFRK